MDSKQGFPSPSNDEEPAPPSYNDSLSTPYNPTSTTSQYYSQQIQSQLHTLTTQISSLKTQQSLLAHAQDEKILSLLTTQIQLYLSTFAKTGLRKGTLILVPAKGLEEQNAVPADFEDKKREGVVEYDQFVRIRDKEGSHDGEGELWFWNDEDMARRLAGYLKPAPDLKNAPLPPRKNEAQAAAAAAEPSSSRGFWGRKRSVAKPVERPPLVEDRKIEPVEMPNEVEQDKISMNVKADEVVFRLENDFGVFETRRGFGIVLELHVKQQKR
ncbi:hypothetical protein D0Z07_8015 [Hyphodiscus hymeniophilus]|uniref:Uncharacterized protein n=1 Tax=Hyphodiscus hymeniophilus TaxID=353542 RepID=A0A9P6VCJ1_9HELO|nr:hypothetical protein D0Z07_8015 [Hyphodiscus hymeniophilus]